MTFIGVPWRKRKTWLSPELRQRMPVKLDTAITILHEGLAAAARKKGMSPRTLQTGALEALSSAIEKIETSNAELSDP